MGSHGADLFVRVPDAVCQALSVKGWVSSLPALCYKQDEKGKVNFKSKESVKIGGFDGAPGAPGGQGQPPAGEQGGPWSAVKK